jgi:anti-anti-sigma factor
MQMLLTRPQEITPQTTVIQPEGPLNSANVLKFHAQLNAVLMSNQSVRLLVDMQHVDLIDNAGVMALVTGIWLAKRSNKQFCLCSVSHPVQMILELTQLDKVLEISDSPAAFDHVMG